MSTLSIINAGVFDGVSDGLAEGPVHVAEGRIEAGSAGPALTLPESSVVRSGSVPSQTRTSAALSAEATASNAVTTDQRMADVGRMWFGYVANPDLPQKLRDHASLEGADYALVLERWTTIGAQIHPAPNIVLAPETLAAFLATNRVVYETGLPGDRILVVQILP